MLHYVRQVMITLTVVWRWPDSVQWVFTVFLWKLLPPATKNDAMRAVRVNQNRKTKKCAGAPNQTQATFSTGRAYLVHLLCSDQLHFKRLSSLQMFFLVHQGRECDNHGQSDLLLLPIHLPKGYDEVFPLCHPISMFVTCQKYQKCTGHSTLDHIFSAASWFVKAGPSLLLLTVWGPVSFQFGSHHLWAEEICVM